MTYWINDDTRLFLSRGYLKEGQTVEERIKEISDAAERILNKPGFSKKLEQYILNGWISLSSPIWANFGTERGLPISCNGSYIEDSMESILDKTSELAMMTKYGAGVSVYMNNLRPRGAEISGGGTSNGPVHFMGIIQEVTDVVSQSNVRRGSCAVYMDVTHPDIMEFLECREEGNHIQHLSLGVCVSNEWLREMRDGDKAKRKIWLRILRKRSETGYPYIFFTDNVNDAAPDVYKDKGLKIHASNLCLVGDTKITIKKPDGTTDLIELEDFVNLWKLNAFVNGVEVETNEGFKPVTAAAKTGKAKKLIRITADSGEIIECTPEHQVFTKNRGWVEAQDLVETDELVTK
jgi:ribonucleoside-diphosphate reductase alpha chain